MSDTKPAPWLTRPLHFLRTLFFSSSSSRRFYPLVHHHHHHRTEPILLSSSSSSCTPPSVFVSSSSSPTLSVLLFVTLASLFVLVYHLPFHLHLLTLTQNYSFLPSSLSSHQHHHHDTHTFPLIATRCYNVHAPDAVEPLSFNSRTFCVHDAPMCITPRTRRRHSVLHIPGAHPDNGARNVRCVRMVPSLAAHNEGEEEEEKDNVRNRSVCDVVSNAVRCTHGQYVKTSEHATCAHVRASLPSGWKEKIREDEENGEGMMEEGDEEEKRRITIVIPAHPWTDNIFHFAQQTVPLFHLLTRLHTFFPDVFISSFTSTSSTNDTDVNNTSLPKPVPVPVTLLFRSGNPSARGRWHAGIISALNTSALSLTHPLSLRITHWDEDNLAGFFTSLTPTASKQPQARKTQCWHRSILLGPRSGTFMWPFASGTTSVEWPFYPEHANRTTRSVTNVVQGEALLFRSFVYEHVGLDTVINRTELLQRYNDNNNNNTGEKEKKAVGRCTWTDLPSNTIVYARRDSRPERTARRLSEDDETWLLEMLQVEALYHGMGMRIVDSIDMENATFSMQVSHFRYSGVIVGLHGANLMNAVFAPAFSALVEVGNLPLTCYVHGANSGLGYWSYRPSRSGSVAESECGRLGMKEEDAVEKCVSNVNWRKVVLEEKGGDRERIRMMVRQGLRYVKEIRHRFESVGKVAVRLQNLTTDAYEIDWEGTCGR